MVSSKTGLFDYSQTAQPDRGRFWKTGNRLAKQDKHCCLAERTTFGCSHYVCIATRDFGKEGGFFDGDGRCSFSQTAPLKEGTKADSDPTCSSIGKKVLGAS